MSNSPTLAMNNAARRMNAYWKYQADGKVDTWEIGKTIGDCEDYVLSVLYYIFGESRSKVIKALMTKKARLIYTETAPGRGHVVLLFNGFYIDNRYPDWSKKYRYEIHKPYKRGVIVSKLLLGKAIGSLG